MKRREDISSCKDMRKKARRKLAGYYYKNTKLLFPLSLICHSSQVQKPGKQRYRKPNECLARVLSVSNECHREAAGFNTFSGSRFLSLYRGGLSTWLDRHLQIMWHLASVLHNQ